MDLRVQDILPTSVHPIATEHQPTSNSNSERQGFAGLYWRICIRSVVDCLPSLHPLPPHRIEYPAFRIPDALESSAASTSTTSDSSVASPLTWKPSTQCRKTTLGPGIAGLPPRNSGPGMKDDDDTDVNTRHGTWRMSSDAFELDGRFDPLTQRPSYAPL